LLSGLFSLISSIIMKLKSLMSQSPLLSGLFSLSRETRSYPSSSSVAIPFVVGAIFPRVSSVWSEGRPDRRNPLCCRGYFPSKRSAAWLRRYFLSRNPLCCRGYFPSSWRHLFGGSPYRSQSPLLSGLFSLSEAPTVVKTSGLCRNPLCCRGYFPSYLVTSTQALHRCRNPLCCRGYFPSLLTWGETAFIGRSQSPLLSGLFSLHVMGEAGFAHYLSQSPLLSGLFSLSSRRCGDGGKSHRRNPLCCRGYFPSIVFALLAPSANAVAIPFVVGAIFPPIAVPLCAVPGILSQSPLLSGLFSLINVSNHPFGTWSPSQSPLLSGLFSLAAAQKLSGCGTMSQSPLLSGLFSLTVIDISHPSVPPGRNPLCCRGYFPSALLAIRDFPVNESQSPLLSGLFSLTQTSRGPCWAFTSQSPLLSGLFSLIMIKENEFIARLVAIPFVVGAIFPPILTVPHYYFKRESQSPLLSGLFSLQRRYPPVPSARGSRNPLCCRGYFPSQGVLQVPDCGGWSQSPLLSGLFSLPYRAFRGCPPRVVAIPFVVGAIFPPWPPVSSSSPAPRRNPLCCRGYFPSSRLSRPCGSLASRNPLCCRGYFPSDDLGAFLLRPARRNPLCCRGYFPSYSTPAFSARASKSQSPLLSGLFSLSRIRLRLIFAL